MGDAHPLQSSQKFAERCLICNLWNKVQQSVLGHVLHLKKTDYSLSMGPLSWPLLFESPHCDKSPRAQCHELTQTTVTHIRTPLASLPPSITHPSSCLCSLAHSAVLLCPPALISQRVVREAEDGEAIPTQKTFHYLFSEHLAHWESQCGAAECKRSKMNKKKGKK